MQYQTDLKNEHQQLNQLQMSSRKVGAAEPVPPRIIQITSLFEDMVLDVRLLKNNASSKAARIITWIMLSWGSVALLISLINLVIGQWGIFALLLIVGLGLGIWGRTRYQEERQPRNFLIGEDPQAHFHLASEAIPGSLFSLVQATDTGYELFFTPHMKAEIMREGRIIPLQLLATPGQAAPAGNYNDSISCFPFPADACVWLKIDRNTFIIQSVPEEPPLRHSLWSRIDWTAPAFHVLSTTAHALILFLIFSLPPDAQSLSLDRFNVDNQFVRYIINPTPPGADQIPAWLNTKNHDRGPQGGGKPHPGKSGKAGNPKVRPSKKAMAIKGTADTLEMRHSRHLIDQAVENAGVLNIIGPRHGTRLAAIFGGEKAIGHDAQDALGNLVSSIAGEDYGQNGLGVIGTGRSGGGPPDGTMGMGGRLGTFGKYGKGGGGNKYGAMHLARMTPRKPNDPQIIMSPPQVSENYDKELVRRVIRRHINEIKFCYQRELQAQPDLNGRVIVRFVISPTGQIASSAIQESTLDNRNAEQCMIQAVQRWLFPKPLGGGIVMVSYPFVLRSAGSND